MLRRPSASSRSDVKTRCLVVELATDLTKPVVLALWLYVSNDYDDSLILTGDGTVKTGELSALWQLIHRVMLS